MHITEHCMACFVSHLHTLHSFVILQNLLVFTLWASYLCFGPAYWLHISTCNISCAIHLTFGPLHRSLSSSYFHRLCHLVCSFSHGWCCRYIRWCILHKSKWAVIMITWSLLIITCCYHFITSFIRSSHRAVLISGCVQTYQTPIIRYLMGSLFAPSYLLGF